MREHSTNSADDTRLGGVVNAAESRFSIQVDLNRLKNWAQINKIKFNRNKREGFALRQEESAAQI